MKGSAGILFSLLALAAGCTFGGAETDDEGGATVPVGRTRRGEFRVVIEEVGVLSAASSKGVLAPYYGKVEKLATEGLLVAQGDPVLWMDTKDLERRLARNETELIAATSNHDKQIERIDLQGLKTAMDRERLAAEKSFEDAQHLAARTRAEDSERRADAGLIRRSETEKAQRALLAARLKHEGWTLGYERQLADLSGSLAQLDVQRKQAARRLGRMELRRENTERALEQSIVRAAAAGRVFLPKIRPSGAREQRKLRVGDQVGQWMGPLMEITDTSILQVQTQVDENLLAAVGPGRRVLIRVTALEGVSLPGRVIKVGLLAVGRSTSKGAGYLKQEENAGVEQVVFPVTVQLEEKDQRLQPGMTVAVTYVLEVREDAVSVPVEAVFGTHAEPLVFLKSGLLRGSSHEERSVQLGPSSAGWVVIESGLEGGERLFLGDPRGVGASS